MLIDTCKKQKHLTVSMRTVAIPNIDIKVQHQKGELPQENFPRFLIHPEITRRRLFKLVYIEYDRIKDKISMMERVDYKLLLEEIL